MPAGLFASLAGAACGPMRKACPARSPPDPSCPAALPRRDIFGARMPFRLSAQRPPRPGSLHCPAFAATRPWNRPRLCIWPSASRPPPSCRGSPILLRQHGSRAPFPWPGPACRSPSHIRFLLSGPPGGGASLPALQRQKIVRSTSIFPAISAPLCKEKSFCEKKREHRPIALFFA